MKKILYILVYASNAQFTNSDAFICSSLQYCGAENNRAMDSDCIQSAAGCVNCPKNMENDGYRCKPMNNIGLSSGMSQK